MINRDTFKIGFTAFLFSFFSALAPFSQLSAVIIRINKIEEAKKHVNKGCIVFIDINNTLIYAKNPHLAKAKGRELFLKATQEKDEVEFKTLGTILNAETKWALPEVEIAEFVKFLEKEHIAALAITGEGQRPVIKKVPYCPWLIKNSELPVNIFDFRTQNLKSFGIDFNKTCPKDKNLEKFCLKHKSAYKNGIIFLGYQSMGDLLPPFLEILKDKPTYVVAIDDELYFLKHLDKTLSAKNISFIGLHYTKGEEVDKDYDDALAKVELDHLIKDKKLLSDEEAKALTH